jgi:signal peptidase I
VLWLVFLRPPALGGTTSYVVVSGSSMEPTLRDEDLVVVRERDDYSPGDVVAFRLPDDEPGPEGDVIHRIVGGSAATGFVTRGDNRDADDEWLVYPEDILGERFARVPRAGVVLGWLAKPLVLGLMVGAALATIYWSVRIHRTQPPPAPRPVPPMRAQPVDIDAGGHEEVAARIRERYERADPATRIKIRELVFQQAMSFEAEDPDFDTAAFLRACGAHAYER